MKTKNKVLNELIKADGYVSGQYLVEKLNVSRVAIKKAVDGLRIDGYKILSSTNRGYFFVRNNDIDGEVIRSMLDYDIKIKTIEKTESTNDDAKLLANANETAVVIAKTQTKGRGRLDRVFASPQGGVYLSVIVRPDAAITDGVKITTFTAVAVARAIEKISGLDAQIKWVNDVYINGKKVCGILTEANCDFESRKLNYAVIGMGINVNTEDLPQELNGIATSIFKETGKKTDLNKMVAEILNGLKNIEAEISSGDYLKEYKKRSFVLGKNVRVISGQNEYDALAVDITDTGALVVNKNGKIYTVSSGEVSVKVK